MLGIAATLVVVAILNWILSHFWGLFVWLVAFTIFALVTVIQAAIWKSDVPDISEHNRRIRSQYTCAIVLGTVEFFLAICVCILMFRMLYYYYQNRGQENIVALYTPNCSSVTRVTQMFQMRPQEETDTEAGTKEKENRKKAGFELAAEPTEVIIFFPTIYYMFGIAVIVTVLSIILWICTAAIWSFFVWATLATLSIGLIIFLQHHQFCNPLVLLDCILHLYTGHDYQTGSDYCRQKRRSQKKISWLFTKTIRWYFEHFMKRS
ncbi:Protein CBG09008 [Caenorhabditis briggsae]|uniref:Protein CBG09008 n=1 Tax=Caenorhabditis briggsae TaxID=6238 RepID=A8X810_CAEBR|nr:Protein CBG09008 [Caenorhabditis briggsae]CAP28771.1 Protein CBG09008 [Caenorhabditis briggsae]